MNYNSANHNYNFDANLPFNSYLKAHETVGTHYYDSQANRPLGENYYSRQNTIFQNVVEL